MFLLIVLMIVGVVVAGDAAMMPPAILEPLGSRAFPFWLGVALTVLSGIRLVRLFRAGREAPITGQTVYVDGPRFGALTGLLITVGMTALYLLAIQFDVVTYALSTAAYLFAVMIFFSNRSIVEIVLVAAGALAIGFLIQFIFTRILFIDISSLQEASHAVA